MKKIVIISDTHCGSIFGLTPPKHFTPHHKKLQEDGWQEYRKMIDK